MQVLKADTDKKIKAVAVVHNETATGVTSDLPRIRETIDACDHPALFMVDGVSSIGALPFEMDKWKVDIAVTGSQKALSLPTGLAVVAVSEKASPVELALMAWPYVCSSSSLISVAQYTCTVHSFGCQSYTVTVPACNVALLCCMCCYHVRVQPLQLSDPAIACTTHSGAVSVCLQYCSSSHISHADCSRGMTSCAAEHNLLHRTCDTWLCFVHQGAADSVLIC